MEWNAENQLIRVTKDSAEVATFKYDPLGRRIEKVAGGVTYSYLYDGPYLARESRSDGTTYRYIHGPGIDAPSARELGTGSRHYYHADGLGSIVKLTGGAGETVQAYAYDSWGRIESGGDEPGFAFTGREWDPEIGLYYYRARYYDAAKGRFISEDPIRFRAGINFYAYARNEPLGRVDPFGTCDCPSGGALADQLNPANLNGSLAQTGLSIWDGLAGIATGDWGRVAAAGATNPLGQTEQGPGWAYGGTRLAVAAAGTAAVAAGGVVAWEAAGGATMHASIGPGAPFHVAYGSGGQWVHAAGRTLGNLRVTAQNGAEVASKAWSILSGIPVASAPAVLQTGMRADTCIGAAIRAFFRGWGF